MTHKHAHSYKPLGLGKLSQDPVTQLVIGSDKIGVIKQLYKPSGDIEITPLIIKANGETSLFDVSEEFGEI